jgi:hypothetical protein
MYGLGCGNRSDPRRSSWRTTGCISLCWVGCFAILGCGDALPAPRNADGDAIVVSSDFDPGACGSITGQVIWQGDHPAVPPFTSSTPAPVPNGAAPIHVQQPNPNVPFVDAETRGVGNAVIFLRGIDPRRARPWDLPPVEVEMREYHFHVRQGNSGSAFGFVRRGDPIAMVSRQPLFHAVHARGAAFFSLMFPDPDEPLQRRVTECGLVELTSAAGHYWMRAYLFVAEHPYLVRTDHDGRFTLAQVPEGECEVVCWMPNWRESRRERDPENGQICRLVFQPPVERVQRLTLKRGDNAVLRFSPSVQDFDR